MTTIPLKGTTFVAGMNAFLNISYTFIGQITLPSFIAEMKEPRDFPKALWAVTIAEIILFSLVGGIVYGYTGNQYNTSPAFGSLGNEVYKKVSFSFMIPTLIFLGVLLGLNILGVTILSSLDFHMTSPLVLPEPASGSAPRDGPLVYI